MKIKTTKRCKVAAHSLNRNVGNADAIFKKAKLQKIEGLDEEMCIQNFVELGKLYPVILEAIVNDNNAKATKSIATSWSHYIKIAEHLNELAVGNQLWMPKQQYTHK